MIGALSGLQVLVATQPVDFRRGAESLASLARSMGHDIAAPVTVVAFRARRADRVKVIAWDSSDLVMMWKAPGEGGFKWPPVSDGVMRLSPAQLAALLEGLEWSRVQPRRRFARGAFRQMRHGESVCRKGRLTYAELCSDPQYGNGFWQSARGCRGASRRPSARP